MDAKELRVENLVWHDTWGEHVTMVVKTIEQQRVHMEVDTGYLADFDLKRTNGIPLTEKWLTDLGIKFSVCNGYDNYEGQVVCYRDNLEKYFYVLASCDDGYGGFYYVDIEVPFVHTLQNAVFVVEKRELTLK